jgi:hypothetical protein
LLPCQMVIISLGRFVPREVEDAVLGIMRYIYHLRYGYPDTFFDVQRALH